jgi:hypothetical protein
MVPRPHDDDDADPTGSTGVDHHCGPELGNKSARPIFDSSIDGTTVTQFCERNEIFTGEQNHYFRMEAND